MRTSHIFVHGDSRKMSMVEDSSVQLIVTSPPYWQLKDYGVDNQIGFNNSYEEYINNLNIVWKECERVLSSGCRLCVNIGDQFARAAYYGRYKVVPIHSEIIRFCEEIGLDYMGSIIWQKQTSMHTTGGQKVMGSYPYPRNGIVKMDYEYILIFKKLGNTPSVSDAIRKASGLTHEEWQTLFNAHWNVPGDRQDGHIAVFPEEIPKRLIKMFSFVGDMVLDPFMGSGTTSLAACHLGRNSIGYELNPQFRHYYEQKVTERNDGDFVFLEDKTEIDINSCLAALPYRFVDHKALVNIVDVKQETYGSKMEDRNVNIDMGATVLVNHARHETRKLMIEKGICYLRAGESKGSLTVTSGFERMQYVALHTAGEQCQLFRLQSRGTFQIWTRETLVAHGFNPRSAAYYIVLHFDGNKPLRLEKAPNLNENSNTFRAKIKSIKEFVIKE